MTRFAANIQASAERSSAKANSVRPNIEHPTSKSRAQYPASSIQGQVHASRITHHASRIQYPASSIENPASGLTHHVSRITYHVSRITHHASRITHPVSSVEHREPSIRAHASRITHHAPLPSPLPGKLTSCFRNSMKEGLLPRGGWTREIDAAASEPRTRIELPTEAPFPYRERTYRTRSPAILFRLSWIPRPVSPFLRAGSTRPGNLLNFRCRTR